MSIEEWDAVIKVHLRGTFATVRWAAEYWRNEDQGGSAQRRPDHQHDVGHRPVRQRGSDELWSGKGRHRGVDVIAATELARYGVTVNAINPGAHTRMTEQAKPGSYVPVEPGAFDVSDPENIAPLVTWLASPESAAHHRSGLQRPRWADTGGGGVARRAVGGQARALGRGRAGTGRHRSRRSCRAQRRHLRGDPGADRLSTGARHRRLRPCRSNPCASRSTSLNGFRVSKLGSRGRPRARSPTTFRCVSLVPPAMDAAASLEIGQRGLGTVERQCPPRSWLRRRRSPRPGEHAPGCTSRGTA